MKILIATAFIMSATSATADIDAAIDQHILPGYAHFAAQTDALSELSSSCDADLKPAYHATFDAWMAVSHIQFGPIEQQGATLSIAFWPDPKNQTGKAVSRLIAAQDPAVDSALAFAEVSVAAQGLFALEKLLYDTSDQSPYTCAFAKAIAGHLAQTAANLNFEWVNTHANLLRTAGNQNSPYQSELEAKRVLYTALSSGLEFLHAQRLGRPLGTFSRPRPLRAEAHRSQRGTRNIALSLHALQDLANQLADRDTPKTDAAFDTAIARAKGLDDPSLQGVSDPIKRLRIEVLQQAVATLQTVIVDEIGSELGVRAGFNSLDGD